MESGKEWQYFAQDKQIVIIRLVNRHLPLLGRCLFPFLIFSRSHSELLSETSAEIAWITEADTIGYLRNRRIFLFHLEQGLLETVLSDKVHGRESCEALEFIIEHRTAQGYSLCQCVNLQIAVVKMLFNDINNTIHKALVSREHSSR